MNSTIAKTLEEWHPKAKISILSHGVETDLFKPSPVFHEGFVVGWAGSTKRGIKRFSKAQEIVQKAGVLLVPVMDEVSALGRQGQTGLKTLLQQVKVSLPEGLKQLKLDFDPKKHSLYRSAMDLGLTLSGNLRRIRKAYRLALETSGL